jgi:hypothetical protein
MTLPEPPPGSAIVAVHKNGHPCLLERSDSGGRTWWGSTGECDHPRAWAEIVLDDCQLYGLIPLADMHAKRVDAEYCPECGPIAIYGCDCGPTYIPCS